jgi:hypothetical protein
MSNMPDCGSLTLRIACCGQAIGTWVVKGSNSTAVQRAILRPAGPGLLSKVRFITCHGSTATDTASMPTRILNIYLDLLKPLWKLLPTPTEF